MHWFDTSAWKQRDSFCLSNNSCYPKLLSFQNLTKSYSVKCKEMWFASRITAFRLSFLVFLCTFELGHVLGAATQINWSQSYPARNPGKWTCRNADQSTGNTVTLKLWLNQLFSDYLVHFSMYNVFQLFLTKIITPLSTSQRSIKLITPPRTFLAVCTTVRSWLWEGGINVLNSMLLNPIPIIFSAHSTSSNSMKRKLTKHAGPLSLSERVM